MLIFQMYSNSDSPVYFLLHFLPCQSLIAKGVRFSPRDTENLGNLVTPPRSVAASDSLEFRNQIPVQRFSAEQTKEAFDVARNSIELLNSVLSSSPPEDILQVLLLISLTQSVSMYTVLMFFSWL